VTPGEHGLVLALREIAALGCSILNGQSETIHDPLRCRYPKQCPASIALEALRLWGLEAPIDVAARTMLLSPDLWRRILDFVGTDTAEMRLVNEVFVGTMIGLARARFRPRAKAATRLPQKGPAGKPVSVEKKRGATRVRDRK